METVSNVVNDMSCPGVLINIIIIIVVLLVGTVFGINAVKFTKDEGTKLKIIVVMIGLYIFWIFWGSFWHGITSKLCKNNLYADSTFVSLSPFIFVITVAIVVLIIFGLLELVKILVGKKWSDIKLLTEFKNNIDGQKIMLRDSNLGDILLENARSSEKKADNLKSTIKETEEIYKDSKDKKTKELLDEYIKKEKLLRQKSKEEMKKARVYIDKYSGRSFIIKNIKNNPYNLKLLGSDSIEYIRADVIIESRLLNGWSGIVKTFELDIDRPDIKYADKSKYDNLFKNERNIKSEVYGKIKFISKDNENKIVITKNQETENYLPEGKGVGGKVLGGVITLIIVGLVAGVSFGLISGETFNVEGISKIIASNVQEKLNIDK